ncbi:hypothetical protein JW921_03060 [Candidatus Fermentibacterales bacterium]|nr:hypothetical protein [Candidatus Fermentibacterales bacterium]
MTRPGLGLILLLVALLGASDLRGEPAEEAEMAGDLARAGYLYELEGDPEGVSRIRCRLLEEALYAGHVNRAQTLISELWGMGVPDALVRFWWGRLAWGCGLPDLAVETLSDPDLLDSFDDEWLRLRSLGLAMLYSGRADSASELLSRSLELAGNGRRMLYSAVDLSIAMLQTGRTRDAADLTRRLCEVFPGEGLALVARGIALAASDQPSSAFSYWSSVSGSPSTYGAGPASMALRLMAELE